MLFCPTIIILGTMEPGSDEIIYDVAIVGGGPGGSTVARLLAKQDLRVILFEKESLPRYKVCAGGLIPKALTGLPDAIRGTLERACFRAEVNIVGSNLKFLVCRPKPIVTTTMRQNFDLVLVKCAKEAGAYVVTQNKVTGVVTGSDCVEVHSDKGRFLSRFIVGADGAFSIVARKVGFKGHGYLVPALESEVTVEAEIFKGFNQAVRFDFGIVPGGYGWVFPKKDHLSIGVGQMRKGRVNLEKVLSRYLLFLGIGDVLESRKKGFVLPLMPRQDGFMKNRALLIGDAAGLVDPMTGEGISSAILSGKIAAHALISGRLVPARVKELYESELKRDILTDLKWGRFVSRLFYDFRKVRRLMFYLYGQHMCEAMTDIISGSKTYGSLLTNPLIYLKLLFPERRRKL